MLSSWTGLVTENEDEDEDDAPLPPVDSCEKRHRHEVAK